MEKRKSKLQVKGFVVGVMFSMVLSLSVLVLANTGGVMREVFFGVNVVVNGQPQHFSPDMTPFISEGRTFLPVRGIADALGVPVNWDGATQTVYIGTMPQGIPFMSHLSPFEGGGRARWREDFDGTRTATMLGVEYRNVLGGTTLNSHANYALNAQYTSLTGYVGRRDGSSRAQTISFIGDDRELLAITVDDSTTELIPFTVDLTGVLILRIQISGNNGNMIGPVFATNVVIQ